MAADEKPSHSSSPGHLPILDYSVLGEASAVVIRRFNSATEAELAALKLQNEGIGAQVAGQTGQTAFGEYTAGLITTDVLVPKDQVQEARAILDAVETSRAQREAAAQAALCCPRCGHAGTLPRDRRRMQLGVVILILGAGVFLVLVAGQQLLGAYPGGMLLSLALAGAGLLLFANGQARRTCQHCGQTFSPSAAPEDDDASDD